MIKINNPLEIAFRQNCKTVFENRTNNFNILLNDNEIYTSTFLRIISQDIIKGESNCIEFQITDNLKIMLSFSTHNVYKKENGNKWELYNDSLNSRFTIKADKEYAIINGILRLGLEENEIHHNRNNELYKYNIIFKTSTLLIKVFEQIFDARFNLE